MSVPAVAAKPRVRVPARSALLTGAAMPVVHFRGIGAAGRPRADDDGGDDMEADEEIVGGDDDKPAGDGKKAKKAKRARRARAEDDDGDGDCECDPDDPDYDPDDPDCDCGDDDGTDGAEARARHPARAARLRERARIAAILESPAAAANADFAVKLALTTDLSRGQAIALLKSVPKAQDGGLAGRMARLGAARPGPGGVAAPKGQAAIDALWEAQGVANGFPPARR